MKSLKLLNLKRLGHQKGFTLIEVLITSFVFSIIILAVGGLFVQVIGNERRAFAAQKIQDNGLYIMELLAREIRVSQIKSLDNLMCNLTSLTISHPINGLTVYTVSGGLISKTVGGSTFSITSSKVNFSRLNFCVMGSGIDNEQPRVVIIASVRPADGEDSQFDIQTSVSSRDLSEELIN